MIGILLDFFIIILQPGFSKKEKAKKTSENNLSAFLVSKISCSL